MIKECFSNVKQVILLYLWGSLVTLKLISLIPLVGSLEENPLAVKLLDNPLHLSPISHMKLIFSIVRKDHKESQN